ncbi:Cobyrinic acid a,c-diamide synthase [Plasmopara halstedii]|uniref:Queuosine 5'-phosphate N-glycosylase/hydrolase n=1 Tax=Plasmopara halstedii TaxID=4781 RepID=A0A0P1A8J2_PLAHL|nr:Cobyrinic acid a,c-diamide synthase [Plasmopara halstedii]CEG36521.1 Cobyrinic acid a,c-diamide synthase [Plasmopara halstedii]|eukprot:XP_024572890.1 Cobyrinic acid a,c-diamide synthase [Plasmopara halstedii]
MDPTASVRESTARVMQRAKFVRIDRAAIERFSTKLEMKLNGNELDVVTWDSGNCHYFEDNKENGPLTCQYVFVLDALNFCFWPTKDMEYEHLARGLKAALLRDPHALDAENLANVTKETVASWFSPYTPPQLDERQRKVQEVGVVLLKHFDGKALNLIKSARCSAVEAIRLVLAYFSGFQDHALYKGEQVHFYKRAQILVGDVWAAYGRRTSGITSFHDIGKLTMFADYRVPQVLRSDCVIHYSPELAQIVDGKVEIPSGSEMEVEIRAATIQAVEQIHQQLISKGYCLHIIELDWLLWQIGEKNKKDLLPHHRTWSIYY